MNRIAVLIPDAEVRLDVACCLATSGQTIVHAFARHPEPFLKYSKFFASFEEYNGGFDVASWLSRLGEIVAERRIDVVLPIGDFAIRTLSGQRQALGWAAKLPELPNPHILDIASDKAKLAELLDHFCIPHPPTVVVTAGIPAYDRLSALEFPVLAKPPRSTGGIDIRRFEDLESVAAFLAKQPSGERWVLQTLIEGHDLAVNVFCQNGQLIAATVQRAVKASPSPFKPAIGLEFGDDRLAMIIAERLVGELGWSGVANIDMRFDARHQTPLVLEINCRYWFSLLGSLNAGVNFPLLACEMCLGELRANRKPHSARYFSGKESVLLSLVGGGKLRIRPHETNLRYLDPLPTSIRLARGAVANLRSWCSRMVPRVTREPV